MFTALLGRECCDSASSIPPWFFGTRWFGAHPACLSVGSQLSCICGEGGGGAEEIAWRVKNLNNSWRQRGQVQCFFNTVCVGSAWCWWRFCLPYCQCCLKCCYTLVVMIYGLKRTHRMVLNIPQKNLDSFLNFLFRKKILVSLICLIVAIYSGPSVPTLMQVHFHRNTHWYIVLKEESCSYSSEFCYASFQVIPQY